MPEHLKPLIFHFVNDLFFFLAKYEIFNFADGNSLEYCSMNLENVFANLINDMENIHEWFVYNSMRANPDKFQFIILGSKDSNTL